MSNALKYHIQNLGNFGHACLVFPDMSTKNRKRRSKNRNTPTVKEQQRIRRKREPRVAPADIQEFVEAVIGDDFHAKQILSLANGVVGIIHSASLAIAAIGTGLAMARGLMPKHAIKQVDRLLSNDKISDRELRASWVSFVVGQREELFVAFDWTEFDPDDHATIAAYLLTSHGRATPLLWKTISKRTLKRRRNHYEDALLLELHRLVPEGVRVTLVADRGFGDQKLYEFLHAELDWDYIIRFREIIQVTTRQGETRPARDWLPPSGRATKLSGVTVTHEQAPVPAVVLVHAKNMKDPWCLATSRADLTASQVVKHYGKRFSIEETFRDLKDNRFGLGLYATHIGSTHRRDRMLFIAALAHALLTMLGAACERIGLDRMLRANTSKRRTHSLYRQGTMAYGMLDTLPDDWLEPLMKAFGEVIAEHQVTREIFAII